MDSYLSACLAPFCPVVASCGTRKPDAEDGGQDIFDDFLTIILDTVMACPKLLLLADKTRKIASSWDQHHRQLTFEDTKATNACPKKGIKNMARSAGGPPRQLS